MRNVNKYKIPVSWCLSALVYADSDVSLTPILIYEFVPCLWLEPFSSVRAAELF